MVNPEQIFNLLVVVDFAKQGFAAVVQIEN